MAERDELVKIIGIENILDDPEILAELYNRLSYLGVPPYYLFQGRPVEGNDGFKVKLHRGYCFNELF